MPIFSRNPEDGFKADFNHIVELFNLEASAAPKNAPKLSHSDALYPKTIQVTYVKRVTAVLCESTGDALQFYDDHFNKPQWINLVIAAGNSRRSEIQ